ncbi:MAG TPA: hypothetical protein VF462_01285 [Micromonosporaceae bacterium]
MAERGWGGSVAAAIGGAAGAGAAQLGLAYGLGIIVWLPSSGAASDAAWVASLGWALWIPATSTVAGALFADRLGRPHRPSSDGPPNSTAGLATLLGRMTLAVAAAIGALVAVALLAVPARTATRADTFSPQTIAAGYAILGVLIGLVVAGWALSSPAVARNVVSTVAWVWLLGVAAVIDGVVSGRGPTGVPLAAWQMTAGTEDFWFRNFYWPGTALSLGSALVIGALSARSVARAPQARLGAAISGGVGPLLVAAAYLLAPPRLVGSQAEQVWAYLTAPYAVIAGAAGSVIAAALADADIRSHSARAGASGAVDARRRRAFPAQLSGAGSSSTGAGSAPGAMPTGLPPADPPAGLPPDTAAAGRTEPTVRRPGS